MHKHPMVNKTIITGHSRRHCEGASSMTEVEYWLYLEWLEQQERLYDKKHDKAMQEVQEGEADQ